MMLRQGDENANQEFNVNGNAEADQAAQSMDAEGWGLWPEQINNGPVNAENLGPDLNAPLEDDLGDMDKLAQGADAVDDQPLFGPQPKDVIDEDLFLEGEPVQQQAPVLMDQLQANNVEVFIPLDKINPDEIQQDDLMDAFPDEEDLPDHPQNNVPLQLGSMELVEPSVDPVFASFVQSSTTSLPKPSAEAIRLWANFFAPGSSNSSVMVPHNWTDFMTTLLVNPTSFMWTKSFLSSSAWGLICETSSGLTFNPLDKCSVIPPSICIKDILEPTKDLPVEDPLDLVDNCVSPPSKSAKGKSPCEETSPGTPFDQIQHKVSPSCGPWSKAFFDQAEQAKQAACLEDPSMRTSQRMKNLKRGFQDPQCSTKGCLGCTVTPPNLSPSVMRNLGSSFCKIDEKELTIPALQRKKKVKVTAPGGKKVTKKKPNNDGNDAADPSKDKKKPKK
ncbi:hypothetical protein C2845_PM17G10450 [Panicum miliaceum]|uniref:Uncharacterized protein n=1 Tax=Panicum miliaceum TaxID=4540 RepID=A0A3L6Q1K8_PANMI|nr:hypothetical protein C2845_PM17G10450 [Panicum miliaceum]